MYKAINSWVLCGFGGERDVFSAIDDAAEFGLDGIELTIGDTVPFDAAESACRKIREYAAARKIGLRSCATGCGWGQPLSSPSEEVRRGAVETTAKALRIASYLGAEALLVIPGVVKAEWDASCPVTSAKTVWENSTRSIKELIPVAEECGVALALENVWNKFLTDPMAMKFFVDQFNSPFVGVYLDIANCLIVGYPEHWVEILGKRIKAIHYKNWKSEDCAGTLHGFGDDITVGEANYPAIRAELDKIGYTGPVTLEMIPFCRLPDMVLPDRELARRTAAQLKEILK